MTAGVTNIAPTVDAHHHLWDAIQNKYPYLTDGSRTRMHGKPLPLRYSIDDYKRDIGELNVEKSVHIQCGWDPADPVGETRWLESIAQAHGYPHAIVAHADLSAPDVEDLLAAHAMASPRLRGIRQHVGWHENPRYRLGPRAGMMNEAAWRRGFAKLAKFRLSFDLQAFYTQFVDAMDLADKFPETTIVLGNSGMPVDRDAASLNGWREALRHASACPNICIKIGGFSMVDHDWSVATIRPFVDAMIDAFGVERCMIGSNFPTDSLYRDFKPMWLAYQEVTANLAADERDQLFRRTATRIYRLDD
jgi:predicted TIM-barrel fold metal-dependent hydrolase